MQAKSSRQSLRLRLPPGFNNHSVGMMKLLSNYQQPAGARQLIEVSVLYTPLDIYIAEPGTATPYQRPATGGLLNEVDFHGVDDLSVLFNSHRKACHW